MQNNETITIWLIYSSCATGTYIEGAYTSKIQAESDLRKIKEMDRNNSSFWIRELQTQPHKN